MKTEAGGPKTENGTKPTAEVAAASGESCDYCGAESLVWRKCKLICKSCGNIIKSCADL